MLPYNPEKYKGEAAKISVENYKVLRSLNYSGTVTLARDGSGKAFVLKELSGGSAPVYRRISQIPQQDNLMQVISVDGNIAVCSFAEGDTLDQLIQDGKKFSPSQAADLIKQLCRAAERLHLYGLIHRDISPKNIIIGEDMHLTLIDFGITRVFTGEKEQDTTICGTEGFAPPEQFGFRETGVTADIYAIGSILRLLLDSCPDCPRIRRSHLVRISEKCRKFDPRRRFRNAAAIRRAVSRPALSLPLCAAVILLSAGAAALLNLTAPVPTVGIPVSEPPTAGTPAAEPPTVETPADEPAAVDIPTAETPAAPVLHTSDMDAPKMEIHTFINEKGYYEDGFEYVFYDDPAVHGRWDYCCSIPTELLLPDLTPEIIKRNSFETFIFNSIDIRDDGTCTIIWRQAPDTPAESIWTNGYLINYDPYAATAFQMFAVSLDGSDYLFICPKTDYLLNREQYYYDILVRSE